MIPKSLIKIILLFLFSKLILGRKASIKNKTETTKNKIDEITSIKNWAKKNIIFINYKLKLNKNKGLENSHNFYYFTANESIPNNTLLLRIDNETMITYKTLNKLFQKTKNKKYQGLWEKIKDLKNEYLNDLIAKQYLYISILIDNAFFKKKGVLYNKYKEYFDMYDYISLDNFPVFYEENEIDYLSISNFGIELTNAIESLKQEYNVASEELKLTNSIIENYLKIRILVLINSFHFGKNEKENVNDTLIGVIPFIDCFNKVENKKKSNAKYIKKKDSNGNYYLEVYSTKEIPKNSEIYLIWPPIHNQGALLYYGFVDEDNEYTPAFGVDIINSMFKKDLNIDNNTDSEQINKTIKVDSFDISKKGIKDEILETYKELAKFFDKYKNKEDGPYQMMIDNLMYYLKLYDEEFSEGRINIYINGKDKRKNIKEIMKGEERIIRNKIKEIKEIIDNIKPKNQAENDEKTDEL